MRANLAGTVLAAITCTALVVLVVHAAAGRMPRLGWWAAVTWAMIATIAIAVADWAWRVV